MALYRFVGFKQSFFTKGGVESDVTTFITNVLVVVAERVLDGKCLVSVESKMNYTIPVLCI